MYKHATFYGHLTSDELPTKHKRKHHISKAKRLRTKIKKGKRRKKAIKDWEIHLKKLMLKGEIPFSSQFKSKDIHQAMVQDKQRRSEKRATNINIPILAFARGWK